MVAYAITIGPEESLRDATLIPARLHINTYLPNLKGGKSKKIIFYGIFKFFTLNIHLGFSGST